MNHGFYDEILYDYAMRWIGKPYLWAGDDHSGFDCSGLVIEILRSCGELPSRGDWRAQDLFNLFESHGRASHITVPRPATLVFFGKSVTKITHVGFAVDQFRMIEAGGGGSKVKTLADAIKYNAFIRMRLIKSRKDLVACLRPYYGHIGRV